MERFAGKHVDYSEVDGFLGYRNGLPSSAFNYL